MIFAMGLKDDGDDCHDGFDNAELESRLFAESQKADRVAHSNEAAGAVQTTWLYGLPSDLWHDSTLSSQILKGQAQEIVNDKCFVAVSNRIKVDIVLVVADKEQAEPWIKGINWHDEQDADDVALLVGDSVGSKVCIDLVACYEQGGPDEYPWEGLSSHCV